MKFSEALDEYLDLRERGPDENGETDKAFYRRMQELSDEMDRITGSAPACPTCKSDPDVPFCSNSWHDRAPDREDASHD